MPTSASGLDVSTATLQGMLEADYQYLCPLYQRPYVWSANPLGDGKLDVLWDDIDSVLEGIQPRRFLGAVVWDMAVAPTSSHSGERWIIDGQQRITTLYLALTALAEVARGVDERLAADTFQRFLATTTVNDQGRPMVKPTLEDTKQFNQILIRARGDSKLISTLDVSSGAPEGVMTDAYEFHIKKISDRSQGETRELKSSALWNMREVLLEKLEFAEITIGDQHDPTEVFDRLNRGGQPLTLLDLIRNEALKPVRKSYQDAGDVYNNYWRKFEDDFFSPSSDHSVGTKRMNEDARKRSQGYLFPFALLIDDSITKARIYRTLTRYWASMEVGGERERSVEIVNHLRSYVPEYMALSTGVAPIEWSTSLRHSLRRVHSVLPTVAYPYLMRLLKEVSDERISPVQALQCIAVVESFLVRRGLLGIEPTGLHAVFKKLWTWTDGRPDPSLLREKLVTNTVRFPTDREMRKAVTSEPLYGRRIAKYVVGEYERFRTEEDLLPVDFELDHVLPQSPRGEWLELFSTDQLKKWTHRWANLVPLTSSDNKGKGRGSWAETREKLEDAAIHFRSTADVFREYEVWDERALVRRSERLAAFALERWPETF